MPYGRALTKNKQKETFCICRRAPVNSKTSCIMNAGCRGMFASFHGLLCMQVIFFHLLQSLLILHHDLSVNFSGKAITETTTMLASSNGCISLSDRHCIFCNPCL